MIYGEEVEVLSEHGEFVRIRGRDGLAGYVKKRLVVDGNGSSFLRALSAESRSGYPRIPDCTSMPGRIVL